MLQKVRTQKKGAAKDFLKFLNADDRKELLRLAGELKGKRVLHVNATPIGGGVAEILQSFIPYLNALGIKSEWYAINSQQVDPAFFVFTKKLHNALQGAPVKFTPKDWKGYEEVNKKIASALSKLKYDILVIHDPQPLAAISFLEDNKPKILFIHIDTSSSFGPVWGKIAPLVAQYDKIVFSNKDFVHTSLRSPKLHIFPPAIDPLAVKQNIVPRNKARQYLAKFGITPKGPLIVQVSRFDMWKNPLGVVEAFRMIEKKYPKAHLAFVGLREAKDDPEGAIVYEQVKDAVGGDSAISLFFDPKKIGGIEHIAEFTMMVQNAADIIIQNSTREGFGLVVTEAMWKGKAVIGGPASGVRRQITNGENGYIAKNAQELASRMDYLLVHPKERVRIGKAAKESVRKNFLLPRLVLDHLKIYNEITS